VLRGSHYPSAPDEPLCCPTNRWQVTWRDSDTEALNACFAREAHLFSAVRHFMALPTGYATSCKQASGIMKKEASN
jgi:hypothetical protein